MRITRKILAASLLWTVLAFSSQSRAATGDDVFQGLDPLTVKVSVLRTRIERETIKVGRILTPASRDVMQQSMNRFLLWAEGYCQGDARCLRNQYWNYLAAIPNSVYRVGRWTVYGTGIYAVEWTDESLQNMDPHRFTWELQLTWPRVDSATSEVPSPISSFSAAFGALAARAHKVMADWVQEGWDRLDVHLEGVNECYVSASLTGSTYSGGAHPYEDFSTFNWNVKANRALATTDLFRADKEWKSEIAERYFQRAKASGADVSEWAHSADGLNWLFTEGFVVTDHGLRFVTHEGATRNDNVPAIDLSWDDLAAWLVPGATCSIAANDPQG